MKNTKFQDEVLKRLDKIDKRQLVYEEHVGWIRKRLLRLEIDLKTFTGDSLFGVLKKNERLDHFEKKMSQELSKLTFALLRTEALKRKEIEE